MGFCYRRADSSIGLLVRALGGLCLVGGLALSGGCVAPGEWPYVGKLAYTQLKISLQSQPLPEVLAGDTSLSAEERQKLALVLEVKGFCEQMGLDTTGVYDSYSPSGGTALFLVAASERLRFEQYEWNWPIVGSLPYKGYFGERAAAKEAGRLRAKGLDVYMGRAGGYSTLGWFSDPVLPPMLRLDELSLIEVVIHEATHRNIFKKGFASFNEGIATYIGRRGVALFVSRQFGQDSPELQTLLSRLSVERKLENTVEELYKELAEVYESTLPSGEKLAKRRRIISAYGPRLSHTVSEENLNNAWILLRRVYTEHLGTYDKVHEAFGCDLQRTIPFFKGVAARRVNPQEYVSKWLAENCPAGQYLEENCN